MRSLRMGGPLSNAFFVVVVVGWLVYFGCTLSRWRFPGQGLNLHHLCDLHHSASDTEASTGCTTRWFPIWGISYDPFAQPFYSQNGLLCRLLWADFCWGYVNMSKAVGDPSEGQGERTWWYQGVFLILQNLSFPWETTFLGQNADHNKLLYY